MSAVTGLDATRVYNVGPVDRIPLGEGRTVNVGGEEVAIFRPRLGRVCAVQATCPHRGGPLADGIVGGSRVVCPLHSYAFELSTGESLRGDCPALRTYRVTVDEQGLILVHIDAAGDDDADTVSDAAAPGACGTRVTARVSSRARPTSAGRANPSTASAAGTNPSAGGWPNAVSAPEASHAFAGRATRIELFSCASPQMRAFHMSWLAFFSVFFAWFGIAPLMPVVREDLSLTPGQVGNTIIASVGATILARIVIGPLCDRYGARIIYSALLLIGSIPVMAIGLASSYESLLLFRLAIGAIGAAFVITQYHTSVMFASNCVGTANATTAGWGNLGGGVTQIVMPLIFAAFLMLGANERLGWRLAMVVPGAMLFVLGIAYYLLTQDSPEGNRAPLCHGRGRVRGGRHFSGYANHRRPGGRARGDRRVAAGGHASTGAVGSLIEVARDGRVWALVVVYGACFGVELTINNVAALYYYDRFGVNLSTAGLLAGLFGLMNLFARTLGGYVSDRWAARWGLGGRTRLLFLVVLAEGLALIAFSRMSVLAAAIIAMLVFSVFVQMAEGATYGIVPFVNRRALGAVAGIVGAGGNAGAVAAGFLFRSDAISYQRSFLYLGVLIVIVSLAVIRLRLDPAAERDESDTRAPGFAEA